MMQEAHMTEYTVHFQKGTRIGARSLRMETVEAQTWDEAVSLATKRFPYRSGYRLTRVDHFEGSALVIDY